MNHQAGIADSSMGSRFNGNNFPVGRTTVCREAEKKRVSQLSHCGRRWDVSGSNLSHETCQQHMVVWGKRQRKERKSWNVSSRMLTAANLSGLIGRFVCCAAELLSNTPTNLTRGRARG